MVRHGKKEEIVKIITTAVTSRDGHVISITIQPVGDSWYIVFAGPGREDVEWARIFWGPRSGEGDVQSLKDHVEKRVRETGASWKGWIYHSRDELPGTVRMN